MCLPWPPCTCTSTRAQPCYTLCVSTLLLKLWVFDRSSMKKKKKKEWGDRLTADRQADGAVECVRGLEMDSPIHNCSLNIEGISLARTRTHTHLPVCVTVIPSASAHMCTYSLSNTLPGFSFAPITSFVLTFTPFFFFTYLCLFCPLPWRTPAVLCPSYTAEL